MSIPCAAWMGALVSGFALAALAGEPAPRATTPIQPGAAATPGAKGPGGYNGRPGSRPQDAPRPLPEGFTRLESFGGAMPESVRNVMERRRAMMAERSSSPAVEMAGCLECHVSLDGITVQTFREHVESRWCMASAVHIGAFGYDEPGLEAWAGGGGGSGVANEQTERTPAEELKRALQAGGGRMRLAGSMRQEMERERIEREKRENGWVNGEPPPAKPAIERAMELVHNAKYEAALPLLREHVKANGEDVEWKRLLAFVLLGAGQMDAGTGMVRALYREDPRLSERPMDLRLHGIEDRGAAEVFTRCVAFANKTQSGAAWLSAAMVAQAQGRLTLARAMVDKGVKVGLQTEIGDAFATAIDAAIARAEREKREGRDAQSRQAALRRAEREGVTLDDPKDRTKVDAPAKDANPAPKDKVEAPPSRP